MRITSKGQVTIPRDIRERFGFLPETEIEFVVKNNQVVLRKSGDEGRRGTSLIQHLRGRATVKMTTDQIMSLTRKER